MGPGGGAMPRRADEKMHPERFTFGYGDYDAARDSPKHLRVLRRMLKRTMKKKRRQADRDESGRPDSN